jgi:hypothetical protein
MNRHQVALAALCVAAHTTAAGGLAIWRAAIPDGRDRSGDPSVWIEVAWPFPSDQWGAEKAFTCRPADCGSEVHVYLRAKVGE